MFATKLGAMSVYKFIMIRISTCYSAPLKQSFSPPTHERDIVSPKGRLFGPSWFIDINATELIISIHLHKEQTRGLP